MKLIPRAPAKPTIRFRFLLCSFSHTISGGGAERCTSTRVVELGLFDSIISLDSFGDKRNKIRGRTALIQSCSFCRH